MFKKILIYILTVTLIFILAGCSGDKGKSEAGSEIPEEGVYTRCIEVEEKTPYNIVDDIVWEYYDEDTLFDDSDLIFKGKVLDEKEIAIEEYRDGRLINTYYRDVSTFEVEEIYYSEDPSLEVGDLIKVANASCSYWWVEGTIKMEKDKEYIVLTIKEFDTYTVKFTDYYDYYTADHLVSVIPVEDGKYYVDEELVSLTENAEEEIIRKDGSFETTVYVKGEEFEDELRALISEKKGES